MPSMKPLFAVGTLGILAVGGGVATFSETATVWVTVPAQTIAAHLAVNLDSDQAIPTHRLDLQVTRSIQASASTVTVTAAYATGQERLLFRCPTSNPCYFPWTLSAGAVITSWPRHVAFVTTAAVTFDANLQVRFAPIRAVAPGSSGNQPAGAVEVLPNSLGMLVATNPSPTAGGVDGGTAQVVQQSDVDNARSDLMQTVNSDLAAAMAAKTAGLHYAVMGQPTIETTADHNVGDRTSTFTLTITATQTVLAFADGDAQAALRSAIQPIVLPGYRLQAPISAAFSISDPASPVVSVDANARALPGEPPANLSYQLAGLSRADATARVQQLFPGSTVEITSYPVALPWLPVVGSRISVQLITR